MCCVVLSGVVVIITISVLYNCDWCQNGGGGVIVNISATLQYKGTPLQVSNTKYINTHTHTLNHSVSPRSLSISLFLFFFFSFGFFPFFFFFFFFFWGGGGGGGGWGCVCVCVGKV